MRQVAGLCPDPLVSLQCSRRQPSWIKGKEGEEEMVKEIVEGERKRGGRLTPLQNSAYATE